ncbi:MAG: hypothetical protein HY474_01575 [Candidatus Sungbacteria bacterium]|uniref:Uncharacterized protein n=1 Tax=Candidatus Sungiibacteriota bacterium TaxID=2750080 RepID=A0A932YWE2_9BACT|nr:hypothetical protein [Candidatus Sungbacteria bacterium]
MRTPRTLAVLLLVVLALTAAAPAEAYHWYYGHPLWGWGWWPHAVGPLYPPEVYVSPQIVIQSAPQTYGQRPAAEPTREIVWYWCNSPQGFYPYVRECAGNAWLKVLPETAPPQQR